MTNKYKNIYIISIMCKFIFKLSGEQKEQRVTEKMVKYWTRAET